MASMTEITCKCGCGRKKLVRTADVKRGWGLFYSKSCKARWQERKTGQYRRFIRGTSMFQSDGIHPTGYGHIFASGDAGHGQE